MSKSLEYIQDKIKKSEVPLISPMSYGAVTATDATIKDVFQENYRYIWGNKGLACEPKDRETGNTKKVNIHYDPNAPFTCFHMITGICDGSDIYAVQMMTNIISDIMYSEFNDLSIMPEGYDDEGQDVYWDYNIECTIGDFVIYKDERALYNFMEKLPPIDMGDGNIVGSENPTNPVRFVVMCPMILEYREKGIDAEIIEDSSNNVDSEDKVEKVDITSLGEGITYKEVNNSNNNSNENSTQITQADINLLKQKVQELSESTLNTNTLLDTFAKMNMGNMNQQPQPEPPKPKKEVPMMKPFVPPVVKKK